MALLAATIPSEVGLRLLFCPLSSNIVTRTACCTIGIGLPLYSTFKAIENKNQNEREKWLLYWAVYGSFSLVEVVSDQEKFISNHQQEIQFTKAMAVRCAITANKVLKDIISPAHIHEPGTAESRNAQTGLQSQDLVPNSDSELEAEN